jgi:hypothetical protein
MRRMRSGTDGLVEGTLAHRITYEEVGLLVPWWKIAIGLPAEALGWWRLRDWCLTYEGRRSVGLIGKETRQRDC